MLTIQISPYPKYYIRSPRKPGLLIPIWALCYRYGWFLKAFFIIPRSTLNPLALRGCVLIDLWLFEWVSLWPSFAVMSWHYSFVPNYCASWSPLLPHCLPNNEICLVQSILEGKNKVTELLCLLCYWNIFKIQEYFQIPKCYVPSSIPIWIPNML